MVGITQLVECQTVTLVVIGSSPITHQINYKLEKYKIKQLYGSFLVNISEYT